MMVMAYFTTILALRPSSVYKNKIGMLRDEIYRVALLHCLGAHEGVSHQLIAKVCT